MELTPCPKCKSQTLQVETPDNHGLIADYSYWQCQNCGWFSKIFYYPDEQPVDLD
jgi:DNA-directed RNA polymerase subunit RPC12/RpoP